MASKYNRVVIPLVHELVDQMQTELAEGPIGYNAINEFASSTNGKAALMRITLAVNEAVQEYAQSAIDFAKSSKPSVPGMHTCMLGEDDMPFDPPDIEEDEE